MRLPGPRLMRVFVMELFTKLFGDLLLFVYHCFDRIVIHALGDALNAGFGYLEVKCLGCNTHQTVALDIVRRPKATPVHELERCMRCRRCSEVRRYPYKRSHLVA